MLSQNEKNELEKKLNEFFYPPKNKTDKYRQLWIKNNENREIAINDIPNDISYRKIKFSPLYNALRDLYYCLGVNPETGKSLKTKRDFGPANLAAVLLEGIICEMLANIKYQKNFTTASIKERECFNISYLKVTQDGAIGIRLLRNAIAHTNYGLMVPVNNHNPYKVKVFFTLKTTFKNAIEKKKIKRGYKSIDFVVNPTKLLYKILGACDVLKKELSQQIDPDFSKWFLINVRRKHWINY